MNCHKEDKKACCEEGAGFEEEFVELFRKVINEHMEINPEKLTNKYAPDLKYGKSIGDLKCQRTPFYMAEKKFGIDPNYMVTFNVKDLERYSEKYPDIFIIFWVKWEESKKYGVKVNYHNALYYIDFRKLKAKALKINKIHKYQDRQNDTQGNAKDSYVLDVRDFECIWREDV